MKKFVAGLFLVAFSVAVIGCGEETKPAKPAPSAPTKPADAKK